MLLGGLGRVEHLLHVLLLTLAQILELICDEFEEGDVVVVLLQNYVLYRVEADHVQLPEAFVLLVEHDDILIELLE